MNAFDTDSEDGSLSPVIARARATSDVLLQKFSFGSTTSDDMTHERIQYSRRLDEKCEVWAPHVHLIFVDFNFKLEDPT